MSSDMMRAVFDRMRADFAAALPEPLSVRKDRLTRAVAMLVDHGQAFADAVSEDFGHRSSRMTIMSDISPALAALKHARKNLDKWARTERRKPMFPLGLLGAKARVEYQPKGVVGVIAPWNFPIGMVMVPLAGILAAGNRAMVKPSEFTPRTTAAFAETFPKYFSDKEIAVVTGGADVGKAFSELPFDHIIFTGATAIGKHIMRAAAENLTPVTLELGGKSPVIVGQSADLDKLADRVTMGKMMNAGQICLAPDYLLVSDAQEPQVVERIKASASAMYPTLLDNDDYTSVVNDRHFARLTAYIDDARAKGARVEVVNPASEDFAAANSRKMPLHIVRDVTDDMKIMQEEIFGPLLPVKKVASVDAAIAHVNAHDRPLGLYYFGEDRAEERKILDRTHSGGVTVNDVLFHVAMEDLPFGGIGPSGMGHYHGHDGFKTFSHMKSVYRQTGMDVAKLGGMKPPYGAATDKTIAREFRK